ncbi:Eco57I restriction-modification methylase domain-containing protein [Pseudopontixanthobacter vadosimaris]|uniref:Eco57I restriction-modification methylase domain-containing protein n=1 Tax=Pseudopontixanthobacter vadosimaris TaxID=2726450 RepID=UPI0014759B99|nr:N-6 DNA methylase [Pseudopontixanthobacter vadosimaris]
MARRNRTAELGLEAIAIEGGLIAPEQVLKIAGAERNAKTAADYGCPKGTNLADEITRYFRIGQALWLDYSKIDQPTVTQTARFARDLLEQAFGFEDLTGPKDHHDGARRYRIALEGKGGHVPIVVAAPVEDGDGFAKAMPEFGDGEGGRAKRNPVVLLQDWLNANDGFYWGLVFAGDRVRLMRDNASLTRAAWIEADLAAMFRDEMFADFTAWWLLTHATRFGNPGQPPSSAPLEQWREAGMKSGTAARDRLREGVEDALREMGQGLIEANPELRAKIEANEVSLTALFEELLRTVYRLIFLAVAEERNLLHPRRTPRSARDLYESSYGFGFWRERSRRRVARDRHFDAWEGMKVTFRALERGQEMLGLPALGGMFARGNTPVMDAGKLPNRRFLEAIYRLGYLKQDGSLQRINWRDMKTEELGSVYESLLEIRPTLEANGEFALNSGAKGNARKTTGSYYTPDSLVETLLDSALDPVLEKAEAEGETAEDKVRAILDLKIIDPACGSGHFLLGAARRMADKVAELRDPDAPDRQAALRDVVARCVHGVDRNPMAVELAKVALWIESVSPGQPLGFLDANIRCGDALLGVFDLEALEQGIPDDAYKPLTGDAKEAAAYYKKKNKDEKKGQGSFDFDSGTGAMPPRKLAANLSTIRRMPEDTVGQVEKKREAFEAWKNDPDRRATRVACDFYTAAFLLPKVEVPENYQRGIVPTTADVWKRLGGGQVYGSLEAAAVDASEEARAFHWPLAFPDVLIGKGGFDVVLGNPPWEVVQLAEKEYFESRVPEIAEMKGSARKKAIKALEAERPEIFAEFARDKRAFDAMNEFARASGRFDLTARGKVNTYGLFAELFLAASGDRGRAGLIVPTGIATDATTAPFFGHLVSEKRLARLFDFENSAPLFAGVHRSFKFCLLTLGNDVDEAEFSFFLTDPAQLEDSRRRFTLSPAEIARINPNTKTAPVFRARKDAELTATIYNRVPVLIDEEKGGKPGEPGNPWGVEFRQGLFNMTSDSHLFRTAEQLAAEGWERQGTDWVRPSGARGNAPGLALTGGRDAAHLDLSTGSPAPASEERYVPLYEGKLIWQFDHRFSTFTGSDSRDLQSEEKANPRLEVTPRYWIAEKIVRTKLADKKWLYDWAFVYRRLATPTNERSGIGLCTPLGGYGDSIFIPSMPTTSAPLHAAFQANFSALAFDFVLRNKLGGLNLGLFVLAQLAILPPSAYTEDDLGFIVPRVLELSYTSHSMAPFARDLGYEGEPFRWDEDRRARLRAELDAWYALAYGLSRDELRYVLDPKDVMGEDYPSETFRVLKNNEIKKHGEYRTQRLVLAAYDKLVAEGMRPRVEGYR